jgi:hypothetical protein
MEDRCPEHSMEWDIVTVRAKGIIKSRQTMMLRLGFGSVRRERSHAGGLNAPIGNH